MTSNKGSSLALLCVSLLAPSVSLAVDYYVDATAGSDSNAGTDSTKVWKTLAKVGGAKLMPGDSVHLKRGAVWTESLYLTRSGTAQNPIVITSYGSSSLPMPKDTTSGEIFQVETGSHMVIEKLFLTGGKWSGVEIADTTSSDITIQNMEISHCGGGLYLAGTQITARNNYIHDGKMVVNTQGAAGSSQANDDYGSTGINMGQINGCSVYGNRLVNLRSPSYDYGYDGGSFEFWRSVRNCEISRNFSYYVDGFGEMGGEKGDSMVNISIHDNVTFEGGNFLCFHLYDPTGGTSFGVYYKGITADNNLQVTRLRDPAFLLLADGARLTDSTLIEIRNNIFASDTLSGGLVYEAGAPNNKSSYVHAHNLVWCPTNNPFAKREKPGVGDIYGNPAFADSLWDKPGTYDSTVAGYVLGAKSPAIGAGIWVPSDTLDFLGVRNSPSGPVDIGPLPLASIAQPYLARYAGIVPRKGLSLRNVALLPQGPVFDILGRRLVQMPTGLHLELQREPPSQDAVPQGLGD